jgi:hypothetical protein
VIRPTPDYLRGLADEAEDIINYAFDEPMVAISQADCLEIADELAKARALLAEVISDIHEANWSMGNDWVKKTQELLAP